MRFLSVVPLLLALLQGCAATSRYGETLVTPLPPGYTRSEHRATDGLEHVEMVPSGEGASNWSEMVETETFKGGVEEGDPVHFSEWLAGRWKDDCPAGTVGTVDTTARNGYPAAFWRMDCPATGTRKPLHTLSLAIQGEYAFYTVQKTWRSDPDETEINAWIRSFFGEVTVCDSASEAGHPCPKAGAAR